MSPSSTGSSSGGRAGATSQPAATPSAPRSSWIRERYPDRWVVMVDHDWQEDRSRYHTARVLACGASRADAVAQARPTLDAYEGFGCRYTGTIRGSLFQLKQLGLER